MPRRLSLLPAIGKALRWHERAAGALMLASAAGVGRGRGVRAGYGLRVRAVMGGRIVLGDGVCLDRFVDLFAREGRLDVGPGCHIGKGCVLVARESIEIGPDCQIAEHVSIRDQDHVPGPGLTRGDFLTAPVRLGRAVWVGAGAVITRGVTIGDGAVIGAGAVVTRDVPAGARALGVPARS